ncbi:hypothetical protein AAG906_030130 [Vitis piasezkii]
MAVVEFSAEDPYGKAVALLNLNNVSSTDINDAPEEEVYGYKNYKDKITNQSTATGREEKTAEEDSKVIPEKDWTWKVGYNNCEAVGKILAECGGSCGDQCSYGSMMKSGGGGR